MRRRLKQSILLIVWMLSAAIVAYSQPVAGFSTDTVSGCAPLLVRFTDKSTGNPVAWKWELGNGTVSFNRNPSTTYFTPGQYSIKLIVQNTGGLADSVVKTRLITVYAPPTVLFKASDTTGCFPLPVQFTDMSAPGAGTIMNWEWDFGDGSTSKLANPTHTYTALGNYNVSLRVTNSNGCITTFSKQNYIRLNNGLKIDYSFSAPENCRPPTVINFTNNSTGTGIISYQWFFGDNSPPSAAARPSHAYTAAGSYSVKLLMRNDFGCRDSVEKVNAINVGTVEAGFSIPTQVCAGTDFSIINNSSPKPTASLWNFGDGTASTELNPVKRYSIPGDYVIRLISDFGACKDSISKTIRVLPLPVPAFTATNQSACQAPLTVTFTNESLNGVRYTWLFGDGSTSTEQKPSHTYQKSGEYDVSLVVTGANGCRDTLRKKGFVQIIPARVSIKNIPLEGCAPLSFKPELEIKSVEPVVSYRWDFGDGSTSAEANPANTYTRPGSYTVKLFFTTKGGCTDSAIYPLSVHVGTRPAVNFTASPREACALQPVAFTDLSNGAPVTRWLWKFGDGTTSTESKPVHIYGDTGYYHVTLIASNNGCEDSLTIQNFIHIRAPIARFKDSSSCSVPFLRKFTDLSTGAKSWSWDFGDGTTSSEQHPSHSFPKAGNYFVKLTVKNDTCENTVTRQVQIISERAGFSASDTAVCKGAMVGFSMANFNEANITRAGWLFGDGFGAAGTQVKHSYSKSGVYSVKFFISDLNGCTDTLIKPQYIRVSGPTANFSTVQAVVCPGTLVSFNDLSSTDGTNAITRWNWKYGDGMSDSLTSAPFLHRYTTAGSFNVQLSVRDSQGCTDSITKPGVVQISKPALSFTSPDSISCSNKNIRFLNQSAGSALSYTWDFGDGTPASNVFQPTHSYVAEGSYAITLKAADRFGCRDSLTKPGYIRIRNPRAGFSVPDSVSTCPPLVTTFVNTSSNFVDFEWNFGDGTRSRIDSATHFYNLPGTYNASLVITSLGGCRDSVAKTMVVRGPQGDFSYEKTTGCTPVGLPFRATTKDKVSFIWDFNDGSTTATNDSIINHIYSIPGKYVPRLILVDPQGCKVPIIGRDTISVFGVEARFSAAQQIVCDSGLVSLRDESVSNDEITSYLWTFSDGSISAERNPSHFFRKAGRYPVGLVATTRLGCTDTSDRVLGVDVVASPMIAIQGDTSACAPGLIQLAGEIVRPDTAKVNWSWTFGNGDKAGVQVPGPLSYPAPGTYLVTSIAVNGKGCADTVRRTINIYPVPEPDAGGDSVICMGQDYTLKGRADNYSWSPSGLLNCADCPNPVARPLATTTFRLTTTNIYGCKSEDSVIIEVKQPFTVNASLGDTLCRGSSLQLFASGAEMYKWTPAAGLDNPAAQRPRATPAGTTTYQVIGTDSRFCFSDTAYVPVTVYPYPLVNAGEDKTIAVGGSINIRAAVSADVSHIRWQPLSGLSCTNCAEPVLTPKQTTTYKVSVENAGGCVASDEVTIFVVCNQGNLFVPNTFSPNGDGKNDVLYPRGKGIFNIKSFQIFNRWGEIVYQRFNFQANDNNTGSGWDGRFKGINAGQDVYIYLVEVVCENGAILAFKGDVTLIR
ncbi:MAG TPA: PKD domain-containing protein [Chitinophagaceae bacterium]|nr:PKD domain-containing protein [Chitinophagaceae bacterium]